MIQKDRWMMCTCTHTHMCVYVCVCQGCERNERKKYRSMQHGANTVSMIFFLVAKGACLRVRNINGCGAPRAYYSSRQDCGSNKPASKSGGSRWRGSRATSTQNVA